MRKRLIFVAGLAVGYVFGSRAGQERYEQLRTIAQRLVESPAVRNSAETAAQGGRRAAAKVAGSVSDRMGDRIPGPVAERVRGLREYRAPYDDEPGGNGL